MAQLRQGEGVGQAEDVAAVVQVQVGVEVARAQPHHGLDLERLAQVTACLTMFGSRTQASFCRSSGFFSDNCL